MAVGGAVAAAAAQGGVQASGVQPAIHGTVHAVARTGFLLSYACPRAGKCVAVGGTSSLPTGGNYSGHGVVVPVAGVTPGPARQLKKVIQVNSVVCPRRNVCLAVAMGSTKGR